MRGDRLIWAATLWALFGLPASAESSTPIRIELEPGGAAKMVAIEVAGATDADLLEVDVDPPLPPDVRWDVGRKTADDRFLEVEQDQAFSLGGEMLYLRFRAARCCPPVDETFRVEVRSTGASWNGDFHLVTNTSTWTCWKPALLVVVTFLFAFFISGAILNSRLLPSVDKLALKLQPVRRQDGTFKDVKGAHTSVQAFLRRELSWTRRLANWLRALPVRFAYPGGRFHEALELRLDPRGAAQSSAHLVTRHRLGGDLDSDPESWTSRLFLIAGDNGVQLVAVPDAQGRIGELAPANRRMKSLESHHLKRGTLLVRRQAAGDEGMTVGWRLT